MILALPSYTPDQERKKIDFLGAGALIIALVPLLLAFTWGGTDYDWNSIQIIGMFVFSIAVLAAFLLIETKAEDPIIPLSLFHRSVFNYSAVEMFLMSAIMMGVSIFIPLFVQGVIGKSASQSGAILTPLMLSMIVAAILSGIVISKTHKYKLQAIAGFVITGIGVLLLANMGGNTENSTVIINMIVAGFGLGIVMPIFNVTAQNSVEENQMGVVTSSIQLFKYMGQTISGSVLGTILISTMTSNLNNMDTGSLPSDIAAVLKNPNTLSNSEALKTIADKLPQTLLPEFLKVIDKMKQFLSESIHQIFIICIVLAAMGIVSMIFMKEVPLDKASEEKTKINALN